jgi:hypothetical protein
MSSGLAAKRQKGPLVRCANTMTESQYLAWIRSALRSKWLKWPPRNAAIAAARRTYKGPNKLQKWEVKCSICDGWHKLKEIEVDHYPHDAGSILTFEDIGPFVNRLYCEVDNLRVVCKPCHKAYTLSQSKGISMHEAVLEKRVTAKLEMLKESETLLDYLASYGYSGSCVSNAVKRRELVKTILKEEK